MIRKIVAICLILVCCTACMNTNKKQAVTNESGQAITESTVIETTVSPYYAYPIHLMSADEIYNTILNMRELVINAQTINKFKTNLDANVISTEKQNGYLLKFIDDYNYSYNESNFVDNIETIQIIAQEQEGKFIIGSNAYIKVTCLFANDKKPKSLYEKFEAFLENYYILKNDHRGEAAWTMFTQKDQNDLNMYIPLMVYKNNNNGFYILEVELPLF